MTPRLSVVVPVRDGAAQLARLVAALERQTLGRDAFEVLIADDGSTDGGCDGLTGAQLDLRVLPGPPLTSYAARNRAAAAARGDVLAFTDADCAPRPDWLERGLAELEAGGGADLVAGAIRFATAGATRLWGMVDMDSSLDQRRAVANGTAATANVLVRRATFDALGGFDATLPSNGDHDFVRRALAAGARLRFGATAIVEHPLRDDARELLRKHWRVNRAYGARQARAGRRIGAWGLLVPIYRPLRIRRSMGRSVRLDRARLAEHAVRPTLAQDLGGLALIYGLLPLTAAAARCAGWKEARAQNYSKIWTNDRVRDVEV